MNDHAEVGKTSFSTALATHLRSQGLRTAFVAVGDEDRDRSVKYTSVWNILDDATPKKLFTWAKKHDVIVCDVQTGYADAVLEMHEAYDLDLELGDQDIELTVITPQVDEADCNDAIREIARTLGDKAYYVVPRIPVDEFGSSLEAWEDSRACRAMDSLGAEVLEIPRITDPVRKMLEEAGLTLLDAMATDPDTLSGELRAAMRHWWRAFERQIEDAADYLVPEVVTRHGFRRSA
jgi:hypothetical protein